MAQYNTLVLSGGAMKGLCILGAIQYCMDNKMFEHIHTYIGTSIGSIIGYLLIIGYTPIEIFVYICMHPIFKNTPVLDLVSMMNGDGAISYTIFTDYLECMTVDKIGKVLTLKQLYDMFNKTLIVTTYNYTQNKLEYISWKNYPDLACLSALRMSSTLPLLHSMFKYMSNYYIDGGIVDNFPILYEKETETPFTRIGFALNLNKSARAIDEQQSFNIVDFMYKLCIIPTLEEMKFKKENANDVDIIELECDVPPFEPTPSSTQKMEAFSAGYQQTKLYFNKKS